MTINIERYTIYFYIIRNILRIFTTLLKYKQENRNVPNNLKSNIMKTYTNTVIINGEKYTNKVAAENYAEALKIQKKRKAKSKNTFEGRLTRS